VSLRIRRSAKSAALSLVTSRSSAEPDTLGSAALRMLKIRLDPGLGSGYKEGARAACCISVDFDVTRPGRFGANHDGTSALLNLSERHAIPLTWAICGKTAEEDLAAYHKIVDSPLKQEIGVHTYSHIYADSTSERDYEEDILKCLKVLGLSSPPATFIFPKNREGHFDLLGRMGFKAYRGSLRAIGAPTLNSGLWNIRPVYYVDQKSLAAAGLIRKFIDACVARSAVFHLWTHPWSLSIDGKTKRMESEALDPVFAHLESLRRDGLLWTATMGELSSFLSSRPAAS
jgi:Polysaccharide deacetylase